MGEAKRRGSFKDRKAEAIKAGRTPAARKQAKLAEASKIRQIRDLIYVELFKRGLHHHIGS